METALTKEIKNAIVHYKPEMSTMRTIRWAHEVSTPTGIVDAIRFEDYIEQDNSYCARIKAHQLQAKKEPILTSLPQEQWGKCKHAQETYPNKSCKGCTWQRHRYNIGILTTCYEIKISISDFHSKNGHNFHGNRNYYVVPKEIAAKILPEVPADIGVISYNSKTNDFRTLKKCKHRTISDATQSVLLYNALKKWVDKNNVSKQAETAKDVEFV